MFPSQHPNRVIIIGCGKTKTDTMSEARDLYTGSLFRARRRYAESTRCAWFILSAEYGLISTDEWIGPYDTTIEDLSCVDRVAWTIFVAQVLIDRLDPAADPTDTLIEIHAGAAYLDTGLLDVLRATRFQTTRPLEGLGVGKQMAWYKSVPYGYVSAVRTTDG